MGWIRSKHTFIYDSQTTTERQTVITDYGNVKPTKAICFLFTPFVLQNTTTSGQNLLISALTHLPYPENDNRNHDLRVHTDVLKEVVNTLILASTGGNMGQLASSYTSSGCFP